MLDVEIWSDIACPWCYVGKRRFETALAGFEHADQVRVTWRSFELDPGAPAERQGDGASHLAQKYGTSRERALEMYDHMTQVAAEDGLEFRFDRARGGNTLDGHRVIHLAAAHGLQDAMKERLLRGYLTEGELISDRRTLVRLAVEVGVPEAEVEAMLASDDYVDAVREDERTAASLGATAVPFFVVDRAFGAAGAQDPELLTDLLRRAWAERPPVLQVAGEGDTCGPDGC